MSDWKFGHADARMTPEYAKSVGIDPASDALAKAAAALDAALAQVDDLHRRLDAILARDAEAAAAEARSRRGVTP